MRLQSAIFDMDGTLLDSMPSWGGMGRHIMEHFHMEPTEVLLNRPKGLTTMQAADYYRIHGDPSLSSEEIAAEIVAYMKDAYLTKVTPKPGVEKFLSILKMEGVWMYVATATERPLVELAMRHFNLDGFFRGILTCEEVGANKREDPEIFERALRRLRSTKKDTVVFEDSLHAVRTAKAAGFRVAAVYDEASAAHEEEIRSLADYYIRTYEEMFEAEALL